MIKVANLSSYPEYFKWEFIKNPDKFNFENWVKNKLFVYDSDNSGNDISYWVVSEDGVNKYYKVYHEWCWWETNIEGFNVYVENIFEITKVNKNDVKSECLKFVI